MSTGGTAQDDTLKCIQRSNTPSPAERLKLEGSTDAVAKSNQAEGGRLKFYIDGKMVLELSDRRENGKTCWVPVVQKTYWPSPVTSCSTPASTIPQGSSTSHSISDESSIQSSPCLRETRWKNPNPTRLLAASRAEMRLGFRVSHRQQCRYQWSQRRRPFRSSEQCHLNSNAECSECKCQWKKKGVNRKSLASVTGRLLDRATQKKLTSSASSPVMDSLVSPRKRLLREMEKVRLHDRTSGLNVLKKAKAVPSARLVPPLASPAGLHRGAPAKAYDRQSSYSIDSLLNSTRERHDDEASASFLRSLLGNASSPVAGAPSSADPSNGLRSRHRDQRTAPSSDLLLPLTLGMASPLHPSAWLPYIQPASSSSSSSSPSPQLLLPGTVGAFQLPLASSLTALALATRPGPSSSDSRSGTFGGRMPTPPDDCDDDDVPLNLTTGRAREHS